MLAQAGPLAALALASVATVAVSSLLESVERQRIAEVNDLLEEQVRERTTELRATELEIIKRLGQAVESRDEETGEHIERIAGLCHKLALAAGLSADEAELLRRASAMHDVGKIAIPDDILRKPEPLTPEEREVMQRHTEVGGDLLAGSRSPVVQLGEVIARTHHERWDGSGLPGRPRRRGDPARRADLRDLRRLRRARVRPPVQGGVGGRGRARRDPRAQRQPFRPAAGRAVPRASSTRGRGPRKWFVKHTSRSVACPGEGAKRGTGWAYRKGPRLRGPFP